MRRSVMSRPVVVLIVCSGAACQREGVHPPTECQFTAINDIWRDYGFNLVVQEPTPRNCPVKLDFHGQSVSFAADVDAPGGTPISPFVYRFFDANSFLVSAGTQNFGRAPNGRDVARISDRYFAGLSGDRGVNQDRVGTEVGIFQRPATAINDTYLPYTCCSASLSRFSVGRVPRTKVGRQTTLRIFYALPRPYESSTPSVRWYKNGTYIAIGSGSPWEHPTRTDALEHTYSSPGTYSWKAEMNWGFPVQRKTMTFTQIVDP